MSFKSDDRSVPSRDYLIIRLEMSIRHGFAKPNNLFINNSNWINSLRIVYRQMFNYQRKIIFVFSTNIYFYSSLLAFLNC